AAWKRSGCASVTAARASATMPPGLRHTPPSTTAAGPAFRKHPADCPVRTSEAGIGGRERDAAHHRADRIGMNPSGGARVGDQPIDELTHASTSTCPRLPPQPEQVFLLERDGDSHPAHTIFIRWGSGSRQARLVAARHLRLAPLRAELVWHSAARFFHDRGPFRKPRLRLRPDGRSLVPLYASSV